MLQLRTGCAPLPEAPLVTAFCSQYDLQQETIVKAAWAHLMGAYYECNSVTFRVIGFEYRGESSVSRSVAGSECTVELRPDTILENLRAIETDSRVSRAASRMACYLQAEAEVDGGLLVSVFCSGAVEAQDVPLNISQVGTC